MFKNGTLAKFYGTSINRGFEITVKRFCLDAPAIL